MQAFNRHCFAEAIPNVHDRHELADVADDPVFVGDRIRQRLPGQRPAAIARRTGADDQILAGCIQERSDDLHHVGFRVGQAHTCRGAVVGARKKQPQVGSGRRDTGWKPGQELPGVVAELALIVKVAGKQTGARRDPGRVAIGLGAERRRSDGVAVAREAIAQ